MYHENIWDLLLKGWFSSLALPSASWVRMANVLVSLRYNPRGGGAWWAAVYGVAQSRTLLKQLCTCSSRVIIHLYYHENTIAFTVGLQRLEKKSRFSPEICGKSMATSFRNLWIRMGFLYKTPQAFNCPWRCLFPMPGREDCTLKGLVLFPFVSPAPACCRLVSTQGTHVL